MNPAILAAVSNDVMNNTMTFAEKLLLSGQMILLGMGTIFVVLVIIWAVLALFRVFAYDIPNKRRAKKEAADTAEAPLQNEAAASDSDGTEDNERLCAVISAAICAYTSSEPSGFRVISFRKK